MQKEIKNKAIEPDSVDTKIEFHFPGSGEYQPITIKAENREEAEKEWEKKKVKI